MNSSVPPTEAFEKYLGKKLKVNSGNSGSSGKFNSEESEPVESVDVNVFPKFHRVISPGTMVTRDYRVDRFNIEVDENQMIKRVYYG
jgi:hypothetical protein